MGGPSAQGMASFLNRLYWFGVVGLCTLGVGLMSWVRPICGGSICIGYGPIT